VRAVLLTPVCPHSPRLSPLILPPDARVEIEVQSPERRPVRAVADGVDLGPIVRAHIGPADDEVRLAFLSGESFTRTLIRKVLDAR
jgi:NAD kinase